MFPANAIVFAKVDLNPSVGQKLAVYQLARKFPTSRDKVTSEESSIKESTFGSIFTGDSGWGLDYKKDVEPWLGDRVGVGVFPDMDSDKQPEVGLAIAVTDQEAAKIALDKAVANAAKDNEKVGYAFAEGFVIVSDTTAHAASLVRVGKVTPLTGSAYVADVEKLGSEQIGVAWVDVAASYKAVAQGPNEETLSLLEGTADPKNMSGRLVVGLHADPSFIELSGKAIDLKGVDALTKGDSATGAGLIASFPADVFGAVSSTGLGKVVGALYPSLTASNDSMEIKPMLDALGIDSAAQIETLLGDETGVVVGGTLDQPVLRRPYRDWFRRCRVRARRPDPVPDRVRHRRGQRPQGPGPGRHPRRDRLWADRGHHQPVREQARQYRDLHTGHAGRWPGRLRRVRESGQAHATPDQWQPRRRGFARAAQGTGPDRNPWC